ncbi:MAG: hypothetical protein AMK75_00165 [Planctomycetes bacterium SM23_65]|nr:MAG: hypothetical protein AMK75_00165 [Planctomycetes bacterium SM23_65]
MVGRQGGVVIPAAVVAVAVMLGWVATVVYYDLANRYYMRDFRTVVITGQPIREYREGEVEAEYTLFEEGGRKHALVHRAVQGFEKMDRWHPEMRYVFARALWREYNGPAGRLGKTPGGFVQKDLPKQVIDWLRQAIAAEPTNCFYRATLIGVLKRVGAPESQTEISRLLSFYPPQNAYGQIRTAEMLLEGGAPKSRMLAHYRRALELVSTEFTSGLLDTSGTEPGRETFPPLGPLLVQRAVDGMLKDVGGYESWASQLPDYPEVHWMVGGYLSVRGMKAESGKELVRVVDAVNRRLDVQRRVSLPQLLTEMFCPLVRPDWTHRFLLNREIGYAAAVQRANRRPEEAMTLYRIQISRRPTDIPARLALTEMLLERARVLKLQARDHRDRGETQKAGEVDAKAEAMYDEADEQVSAILAQKPRDENALKLREGMPKRVPQPLTP